MNYVDQELEFLSCRSPVYSKKGMVAASQPLAVAAGLKVLGQGGNAADAAIAVAAALNVTEPTSTGLGGDCFGLFYDQNSKKIHAINGSGRAPTGLTLDRLKREGFKDNLPPFHPYTITVPGACAGWCDLITHFGSLDMGTILGPAIHLAEEGFPVAPITAYFWQRGAERQLRHSPGGEELTINGKAPRAGEVFRNVGLAHTMRMIAEHGKDYFYNGPIAEAIAGTVQKAGGCLAKSDLANHHSSFEDPISVQYRDIRVWECAPNGQGLAALLGLNILESFDIQGMDPLSVERLHLEIEAMRIAFADARWYISDPDFSSIPVEELLSKEYARERRKLINLERANPKIEHGNPLAASDTVYLCVVDTAGNGCSFINSNYMGFGTGIVPPGYGFTLQNRGYNFSLDPNHPNCIAPGKRPYHTIIPALATRVDPAAEQGKSLNGEDLFACFGVMGGFMQPQGHLQVVTALVDDRLDPQSALDRPRFCIEDDPGGGRVAVEDGIPIEIIQGLADKGHPVERVTGHGRALFGRGQIIIRDASNGALHGGSDPRADGCVMSI